jgi:hypothetical protein
VVALHATLVRDGRVDVEAFASAARAGLSVGACACGGPLYGSVERGRGLLWLTTRCRRCGNERTSPDGRLLPRPPGDRAATPQHVLDAAAELDARRLGERDAA